MQTPGDRWKFDDKVVPSVHSTATGGRSRAIREALSGMDLTLTGPALEAIRHRLAGRASRMARGPSAKRAA
jgi:hypothetical protein